MRLVAKQVLKCGVCGSEYPEAVKTVCDECFGPLKVQVNLGEAKRTLTKNTLAQRTQSFWRYFELLPLNEKKNIIDIGTTVTPLVKATRLGKILGLNNLYIKNDAVLPTYSFKDRPVTVGASKAVEFGFRVFSCASTGNLAASTAAHAAKAGVRCFVFVAGNIEESKIASIIGYGPTIISVEGIYDVANRLANEAADKYGWAVMNVNVRPYYQEGEKTLSFETCEQLEWRKPDAVVVPVGSGSLLYEIHKGFKEFEELRFVDGGGSVRFYAAQGEGASPVVDAVKSGGDIKPYKEVHTIAKSIAMGAPGDGDAALNIIRETRGGGENPGDAEILEGIRLLAQTEGILTEPAGGTTIAALKRLAERGAFDANETIVAYITGNGLKTVDAIPKGRMVKIKPRIEEVDAIVRQTRG